MEVGDRHDRKVIEARLSYIAMLIVTIRALYPYIPNIFAVVYNFHPWEI